VYPNFLAASLPGSSSTKKARSASYCRCVVLVGSRKSRAIFVSLLDLLLNIYPQKGTVVSLLDIDYIEQAMFIRMSLEVAIIKLACQKFSEEILYELRKNLNDMAFQIKQLDINTKRLFSYDTEFHRLLYKGTGMMQAWFVISQVSTHLNRARYLKLLNSDIHWEGIIKQHTELVDAIEHKEAAKAIKVLNSHLGGFDMEIYKLKENHQDLFI